MGRQHVLQQQAVQVLSGLDLILLRAVLVLEQEVLAEARLVLADRRWRMEDGGGERKLLDQTTITTNTTTTDIEKC